MKSSSDYAGRGVAVRSDWELPLLPSRLDAIRVIQGRLKVPASVVLLTGEAGAGKTWLIKRLAELELGRRVWHVIDVAPGFDHLEMLRTLALRLGLGARSHSPASVRALIADELANANDEGRRHVLVIDQAQGADLSVFQEARLVANRLGQPDGFDGLLLVGQTSLLRGLTRRDLRDLGTRVDLRVHLRPLDADEAAEIVRGFAHDSTFTNDDVERLHRDALGNPARLLQALAGLSKSRATTRARGEVPFSHNIILDEGTAPADADRPWIPTKPPLRSEDNLIEVGWESDGGPLVAGDGPEIAPPAQELPPPVVPLPPKPSGDRSDDGAPTLPRSEAIDDPYAALQVWLEAELETPGHEIGAPELAPSESLGTTLAKADDDVLNEASGATVWPDVPHPFEPFGDLFNPRSSAPRIDP